MTTRNTLAARIGDMLARNDLTAQIKQEIDLAIRRYEREAWFFNEARTVAIDCVAGQTWYDTAKVFAAGSGWDIGLWDQSTWDQMSAQLFVMPTSSILSIDYMRIRGFGDNLDDRLLPVHYSDFERLHDGSASVGQPTNYARYSGQIGLWPAPVGPDVVYMSCKIKPLFPESDDVQSVWFLDCQELIECSAVAAVAEKFLREYDMAAVFKQREAVQIAALRAEGTRKTTTRRIRASL